jgi:hypothetical protein
MSFKIYFLSISIFLLLLLRPSESFTQSLDHIRSSGLYYYGIGEGPNLFTARNQARASLSESITVRIKSEFEHVIKETNDNIDSYTNGVVSSFSTAVIGRQEERVLSEVPGRVEVLVYITRASMNDIFNQREQLIRDFIRQAGRASEERRISDALRYYYWALVLTRSHPDNNKLRHIFEGTHDEPVMMGLYDRINRIFSFLKFEMKNMTEKDNPYQKSIHLTLTYRDQPVQDLDYSYWLGDGYSPLITARDGIGYAMLEGEAARQFSLLRVRIEYQYNNKAHLEPEVKTMMESVSVPYFPGAEKRIELKAPLPTLSTAPSTSNAAVAAQQQVQAGFSFIDTRVAEYNTYQSKIKTVVNAIRSSNHLQAQPYFTAEGYQMYRQLFVNARVTVLDAQTDTLRIMRVGNETMVRSVPMLFAYENNRQKFIENVVFDFNKDDKISNISFSLGSVALNDILSRSEAFGTNEEKYILIRFMENYKTAFALKRMDYLDAIFDENALIIVGNIVKSAAQPVESINNMYGNLSNDQVEYIRLSKSEYMERLKRNFSRNEFINIHFEDNTVRKTQRNDKIYGIQIAQHYYSSTYADKGYLFLMIDLNDSINPKIYVRTWQPQKNADGTIYGLEDFRF